MSQIAYLGLGSNLGDREANLRQAVAALVAGGLQLVAESSVYETDPVDFLDQPRFLNQIVAVTAPHLDPYALMKLCFEVESQLGRQRIIPRAARTIDIDLLLFGDYILDGEYQGIYLTVPHPRMHLRRFVLQPLAEIAPHLVHITSGRTIQQLLDSVADDSAVQIYRP
ncbi:MAG: 2-amino-4-hydroxy-6-hydroxymethyldihydropteridine diphosphokinase [Acidobacteria bacterium]|nr:2-amino-4-hydroxy-6-hydroxymethyldihydropteridine diphosphokinase [Acidobacteriota bacterium]